MTCGILQGLSKEGPSCIVLVQRKENSAQFAIDSLCFGSDVIDEYRLLDFASCPRGKPGLIMLASNLYRLKSFAINLACLNGQY